MLCQFSHLSAKEKLAIEGKNLLSLRQHFVICFYKDIFFYKKLAFWFLWTYAQCNEHVYCKNGCNLCFYQQNIRRENLAFLFRCGRDGVVAMIDADTCTVSRTIPAFEVMLLYNVNVKIWNWNLLWKHFHSSVMLYDDCFIFKMSRFEINSCHENIVNVCLYILSPFLCHCELRCCMQADQRALLFPIF